MFCYSKMKVVKLIFEYILGYCPKGYYFNSLQSVLEESNELMGTCARCHPFCKTCTGPKNNCLECTGCHLIGTDLCMDTCDQYSLIFVFSLAAFSFCMLFTIDLTSKCCSLTRRCLECESCRKDPVYTKLRKIISEESQSKAVENGKTTKSRCVGNIVFHISTAFLVFTLLGIYYFKWIKLTVIKQYGLYI